MTDRRKDIISHTPISDHRNLLTSLVGSARQLFFRLFRYGLVGACATALYSGAYLAFVTTRALIPFTANLISFIIALGVSFFGHREWTFGDIKSACCQRTAFLRFLSVSLFGLTVNSIAVLVFINRLSWPDWTPLIVIIGITPIFTFLLNRFWVFPHQPAA